MSKITLKILNNKVVTAIPQFGGGKEDDRPIKGKELFDELYPNVFLTAMKNSGKTSTIYHIIKNCATRDTTVIIFASTVYNDKSWVNIRKYLDMRKIPFEIHTAIKDEKGNHLNELVSKLAKEAEQREIEEKLQKDMPATVDKKKNVLLFDSDDDEDDKPKKKSKFRSPDYIIVLDDLSEELKMPALNALLKKNRHFRAMTLLSSQDYKDVLPTARANLDYFIIFGRLTDERLAKVYNDASVKIPFELFKKAYEYATKDKYTFLYINTRDQEFRKNFNVAISINS